MTAQIKAGNFRLEDYLKRIGFEGEPKPDLVTLTQMMRRQLRAVPFENLDVQAGKVVSIVPEDVVAKIMTTRRGGYCYEVNSLFAMALEALGFSYQIAGARPMPFPARKARTHMVLIVSIDGKPYLCDTGYGKLAIREPVDLCMLDVPFRQDHDIYRLIFDEQGDYVIQAQVPNGWDSLYSFNLDCFELCDFIPSNWYNSTSPDAIFTQKRLLMRHTETGRILLVDGHLRIYENGEVTDRTVPPEEIASVVRELFGLELPPIR